MNYIIPIVSLGISISTLVFCFKLNRLKKVFLKGKDDRDWEAFIHSLVKNQEELGEDHAKTKEHIRQINKQLALATQKVGLVRFNPFDDGGGNFSFSLALLDAHQTGVVITSMHGRQQNRIYTKKITQGQSESELTEEESQAITQANSTTIN